MFCCCRKRVYPDKGYGPSTTPQDAASKTIATQQPPPAPAAAANSSQPPAPPPAAAPNATTAPPAPPPPPPNIIKRIFTGIGKLIVKFLALFEDSKPLGIIWDLIIFTISLYNAVILPYRSSFLIFFKIEIYWYVIDAVTDFLLWIDIILLFFKPYEVGTDTIKSYKKTALNYLKGWFIFDFAASFPLDWIQAAWPASPPIVWRLNRLIRTVKLLSFYFGKVQGKISFFSAARTRLTRFLLLFVVMSHWLTCVWSIVLEVSIQQNEVPLYRWCTAPNTMADPDVSFFYLYITGFNLMLSIMSGFGGAQPVTNLQVIFSNAVILLGMAVYSAIMGTVRSYISNSDAQTAAHLKKMDSINDLLKNLLIDKKLKDRIVDYYIYLWKSRQGLDETKLLNELPDFLRIEVSLHLNKDIIEKVPLFHNVDKTFLSEVVLALKPRTCLPMSYIIRTGETGAEMYFLSKGTVEVCIGEGANEKVVASLGEGKFFGEIALIYNMKRTASVRAKSYVDLFILTKKEFDVILAQYPEEGTKIKEEASKRYAQIKPPPPKEKSEEEKKKEEEEKRLKEEEERKKKEEEEAEDDSKEEHATVMKTPRILDDEKKETNNSNSSAENKENTTSDSQDENNKKQEEKSSDDKKNNNTADEKSEDKKEEAPAK